MTAEASPETFKYPVSLSFYLSKCGVASRRKSTEIIKAGEVTVNGITVSEPGFKLNLNDKILHRGKELSIGRRYYIMLNKPRGYVCTSSDPFDPKKAIDLINIKDERLFSAGRLDKESEGLIIFTNDGDYALRLTAPRYKVRKTYLVGTSRPLNQDEIRLLKTGIEDEGDSLHAEDIKQVSPNSYKFIMNEGKKREIRRLLMHLKIKTVYLRRLAIGKLFMNKLEPGKYRFLSKEDIELSLKN